MGRQYTAQERAAKKKRAFELFDQDEERRLDGDTEDRLTNIAIGKSLRIAADIVGRWRKEWRLTRTDPHEKPPVRPCEAF